ncbi:hypothetical protein JCM3775_001687 [Rhodotorula graminis]
MLSAARRAAPCLAAPGAHLVEHLHRLRALVLPLAAPSSSKPFSTSTALQVAPQQRLSKVKRDERLDKLARKREIRAVRRGREAQREEAARLALMQRRDEVQEKQAVAEEIAESLPPFSDDQLESMYQGLLAAPASEFAMPALEASKAPALPDPAVDSQLRQDRLARLAQRLQDLEAEEAGGAEERDELSSTSGSLAARLRRRRVESGDVPELAPVTAAPLALLPSAATARAVLDHLETVLPRGDVEIRSTGLAGLDGPLARGLLARGEWNDLILSCAEEGDTEGVKKGLELMERTTPIVEGTVLEQALAIYASQKRPQDALALASFARQHSLPLSVTAHHHLLNSILPSHPELAVRHLHSMEAAGHTPLLATYNAVAHRLLSPASPPHLVRQGWDLFSHARLVAYPVPDVALFATMIQACSHGAHPSPERAIDLFTEMADDKRLAPSELAYNGVIRACAREGSQEYYHEALRFMRRMLDEHVAPSRHTFHALLEGAKRHGDLARARWVLVKMVGVGGEAAPNETTLALVLQTYAAFRPPGSRARHAQKPDEPPSTGASSSAADANVSAARAGDDAAAGVARRRPSAVLVREEDPAALPLAPLRAGGESASTLKVIEMLGEASLFYPGPLPETAAEVAAEARNLMLQVVDPAVLAPPSAVSADEPISNPQAHRQGMFPGVTPSTFLLNAYLAVLNSHTSFSSSLDFFLAAFTRTALAKNRYTFEIMMRRCEIGDVDDARVAQAKQVWEEWVRWSEAPLPPSVDEPDLASLEADEQELWREKRRGEEEAWAGQRRNGKHVAKLWGGLIRVLAKAYKEDEALAVLQRFVQTYPPTLLRSPIRPSTPIPTSALAPPRRSSLAFPVVPIRLSSPLYLETSPSLDPLRAPHLTFSDLALLHKRLADVEDKDGLALVKWAAKSYEGSIRMARRSERRDEGRREQL